MTRLSLAESLHGREFRSNRRPGRVVRELYGDKSWIKGLDIVNELDGHSGCVNALSWSKSGRLLASGSDDQHLNIHSYQPGDSTSQFVLTTTVATGHTENIFSVKFMPHSNDRTLITAAGDSEVRVFDLEYAGASTGMSRAANAATQGRRSGRNNIYNGVRYLSDGDTNCRVYRSHANRAKRIVTESSPHLFLTCSEDGEVRQWDLRQPSSAYPAPRGGRRGRNGEESVPPPLISYKRFNLDLNTISCSLNQPHYIALGGAHLHCFLHDRRMLGRDRLYEQGRAPAHPNSETDEEVMRQATQCVRRFAPNGQNIMRPRDNGHITACKISDARPNEMVVSWSGEHIYSFDLLRSPDASEKTRSANTNAHDAKVRRSVDSRDRKRKRKVGSQVSLSQEDPQRASSRQRTASHDDQALPDREMALRVQYDNGQSEDIPIENPARPQRAASRLRDSVLTDTQRRAYRLAKMTVRIRQDMFTLGTRRTIDNANPTGHSASFTSVLGHCAVILPELKATSLGWRYPVMPSETEVIFHRTLRTHRDSTIRFVQAAGVLARALGGSLRTAGPGVHPLMSLFQRITFAPNEHRSIGRNEQFGYDFIKAILLWLESGIGALLEGFTKSSDSAARDARLPVPRDAGIEALEEHLIPYLLSLASQQPIANVDASKFEVDESRLLYGTEHKAVMAFAEAVKVPFADLSSVQGGGSSSSATNVSNDTHMSDTPTQDRKSALHHWGLKVGRGVLMNAGEGVNFALVDRAFGGLGTPDAQAMAVEAQQAERHELIDTESEDPAARSVEVVTTNPDLASTVTDIEEEGFGMDESFEGHEPGSDDDDDSDGNDDDDDDDDAEDESEDDDAEDESEDDDPAADMFFGGSTRYQRGERQLKEMVEAHIPCGTHSRVYRGHCNVRTVKDVNYFGLDDEYVVSGSDDGNVFIWDCKTSQLVNILHGDGEVVNVAQGHPYEPMLAVSGIDHSIKIFSADARARQAARLGRGVEAADPSDFSSIAWPHRFSAGRRARQRSGVTSEPAVAGPGTESVPGDNNDEYVAPNGLASRKRMHQEYQITSANDVDRQGGNQEAFITRSMLAQLARTIQRRRAAGEEFAGVEVGEEGEGFEELGGRIVLNDNCTVM